MSIIDNVLITIDDDPKTKDALESLFPTVKSSVLFSALGRLVSKNLVSQKGKGKNRFYEVTSLGADIVESSLDDLRNIADQTDLSWILVSISIPEKHKVERERLRMSLKKWGFGLVRNGLFAGRVRDNKIFNRELASLKNNAEILVFSIIDLPNDVKFNPKKYWKIDDIKRQYADWIKRTNNFIKSLPKSTDTRRIIAKSLVYDLAEISKNDPKISDKKFADSINRTEAFKLYRKIRDYCYR